MNEMKRIANFKGFYVLNHIKLGFLHMLHNISQCVRLDSCGWLFCFYQYFLQISIYTELDTYRDRLSEFLMGKLSTIVRLIVRVLCKILMIIFLCAKNKKID